MKLNTDHLARCLQTLESSLELLSHSEEKSIQYEIYRNATVKGFELALETAGKLLRKAITPYFASHRAVDELYFKDLFRHAAKHGLLNTEEVERWFAYRDNRNIPDHDYGEKFAEETLKLMPGFIADSRRLKECIDDANT